MIGRATPRMPAAGYTTREGFIVEPDLETTVTTTGANQSLVIRNIFVPGGTSDIVIHWGDGTSARGVSSATHTYELAGTYTLKIFGIEGVQTLSLNVNNALKGDLSDYTGLTSLRTLALAVTGVSGDIGDVTAFSQMRFLNISQTTVSGDVADISGMSTFTSLFLNSSSVSGDVSAFSGMTGLQFLGATDLSSLTGDLSVIENMPALRNAQFNNSAVNSYTGGGSLSEDLTFLSVRGCSLDATALGNLVDALHAVRVSIGGNGCFIDLSGNPGSASVASSHSTKISELEAAGCTVTI